MRPQTWAAWALKLQPEITKPGARVLLDGRSGSGKSTLAAHLVALAADQHVTLQCVHLEDIYPGWDGLEAASRIVVKDILEPLRAGRSATWSTWDWYGDEPGPSLSADDQAPLLIEGAGALTRASAPLATFSIWVEASADIRRARAFDRDGDLYRPHWDRWAEQEATLLARENSPALADVTITSH